MISRRDVLSMLLAAATVPVIGCGDDSPGPGCDAGVDPTPDMSVPDAFQGYEGVIPVAASDFEKEVLNSKHPVVVRFYADWCGPCNYIAPHYESLANQYKYIAKFTKFDVTQSTQEAKDIKSACKIQYIPAFRFFHGGKEHDGLAFSGAYEEELTDKVKGFLAEVYKIEQ
jgi:thioredoxin 1